MGGASVAFSKTASLTQLKAEVLTISRKVLGQALQWKQHFTAGNVLNILAAAELDAASDQTLSCSHVGSAEVANVHKFFTAAEITVKTCFGENLSESHVILIHCNNKKGNRNAVIKRGLR